VVEVVEQEDLWIEVDNLEDQVVVEVDHQDLQTMIQVQVTQEDLLQ
tara:strand:+ start:243 stop:380 length:138 start_codon:yes stop_codon:yes gene_type:complete